MFLGLDPCHTPQARHKSHLPDTWQGAAPQGMGKNSHLPDAVTVPKCPLVPAASWVLVGAPLQGCRDMGPSSWHHLGTPCQEGQQSAVP